MIDALTTAAIVIALATLATCHAAWRAGLRRARRRAPDLTPEQFADRIRHYLRRNTP